MASLFGKNKLKEVASRVDTAAILPFVEIIKLWQVDYHSGTLKTDKETSREQQYNRDFFLTILGYLEKPAAPFSFEPKATTDKGQLPDAVISYTDKANDIKNVAAVVELKGAAIELDRPQRREGNMSPVQQGFKYKTQYRSCPFVIVSNFWEFRLYHDNQLDYDLWTLDDLVNPEDDYILFKTWFTLFQSDNFISPKGASKTQDLLSDIRIEQENIGRKFYKVYRDARLALLADILRSNELKKKEIPLAIEKAQKIVDRIVFTCFAEDSGLLPDNIIEAVVRSADNSAFGGSIWNALKGFFEAIDHGSDKLDIPQGYNGGLFAYDEKLNNLNIGDDALRPVLKLSGYDFSEELSVNILGHIFEQSITDLDEIKSSLEVSQNLETLAQNRRKKDGIFYTPDYIVRYIVDNSLGAYLREYEDKFKDEFGLKGDIADKTYEKRERQAYAKYQDFLQDVKVVDPACGSGAFLVYVFDYLLAENKRVGDILGNSIFSSDDYIRDILGNNIYGVDLNEESVEITRLSLWLKSAQKGKKLTTLDANIKCGNSLIDDPTVAGDKAFNWQNEFQEIFANGGFDVVIGNPPYFNVQTFGAHSEYAKYLQENFPNIWQDKSDILFYFFALAMQISKGSIGYITSNAYLFSDKAQKLRNAIVKDGRLKVIVNFEKHLIFADASITSCISIFHRNKEKSQAIVLEDKTYSDNELNNYMTHPQYLFEVQFESDSVFALVNNETKKLNQKIDSNHESLRDLFKVGKGMETAANNVFLFNEYPEQFPEQFIKKRMSGEHIHQYYCDPVSEYLLYLEDIENFDDLPNEIQKHLIKNETFLRDRADKKRRKTAKWWNYTFPMHKEYYGKDKIWCSYRAKTNEFLLDTTREYIGLTNTTVVFDTNPEIQLTYLVGLLNSKVLTFRYRSIGKQTGSGVYEYFENGIGKLPIPRASKKSQEEISVQVKAIIDLYEKLSAENEGFEKLVMAEFELKQWPQKLEYWWRLDFADFIKPFQAKLSLRQKDELLQLFNKYRTELQSLDNEIQKTDQEINSLVYKLYDLTPEEISQVEKIT